MTGLFVRIERKGKWQSIELDELTDGELDRFIQTMGQQNGWPWVKRLVQWIRDNVGEEAP